MVATRKVDVAEPPDGTLTGLGMKLRVLLGGQPVEPRVTFPLKPFIDFRVSVYLAVPPGNTEVAVGLEEIEKSGAITTRVTVVVFVRVPSVPWIVNVYVPPGVVLVVWTVKLELAAGGTMTDVGLNVQVLPVGQPALTLRLTVLLYPFKGVTVTV